MSTVYLYVKRHTVTGLKYFGKTIQDPYTYAGSGKRWRNHIRAHGRRYVETTDVWSFTDPDECSSFASDFSIKHNIVESSEWANLALENGTDGGSRIMHTDVKRQIANSLAGVPKNLSSETRTNKNNSIGSTLASKAVGVCPHCGKQGKLLGRFLGSHFDNCKMQRDPIAFSINSRLL